MKRRIGGALLFAAVVTSSILAAGVSPGHADEAAPELVAVCLSCHGNGMVKPPDTSIPIIAGQQYDYLLKSLKAYRAGERTGESAQAMIGIVDDLKTDDRLAAAASFFATLRPVRW